MEEQPEKQKDNDADEESEYGSEESNEESEEEPKKMKKWSDNAIWNDVDGYGIFDEIGEYDLDEYEMDELGEHVEGESEHPEMDTKKVTFTIIDDEAEALGGDFMKSTTLVFDKRYDKVYDFDHEEEEEEEAEEEKEEEELHEEVVQEAEFVVDREHCYDIYHKVYPGYNDIKIKNNFLQKKMVEYFSKRKMDHVMKEDANYDDNYLKYCKKLNLFMHLKKETKKAKNELLCDINAMKEQKLIEEKSLRENLDKMYGREKEIGTGLIMAKTGKLIPEKLVERLIRNQMLKTEEMSTLRLQYIKVRDKITEMESACEKLDKIGDNYTIMDYEQLKIERRNHTDKIEERDEELSRLRTQCSNAIQCLAHIREKLSAVQDNIVMATINLDDVEKQRFQIREILNGNKQQRDYYRMNILKEKENAGLLTKPKLLRDMEDTMHERDRLQSEMEQLKLVTVKYKNQIESVKSHIKKNVKRNAKREKLKTAVGVTDNNCNIINNTSTKTERKLFKGRPSLLTIKDSVCDEFLQTTTFN